MQNSPWQYYPTPQPIRRLKKKKKFPTVHLEPKQSKYTCARTVSRNTHNPYVPLLHKPLCSSSPQTEQHSRGVQAHAGLT